MGIGRIALDDDHPRDGIQARQPIGECGAHDAAADHYYLFAHSGSLLRTRDDRRPAAKAKPPTRPGVRAEKIRWVPPFRLLMRTSSHIDRVLAGTGARSARPTPKCDPSGLAKSPFP